MISNHESMLLLIKPTTKKKSRNVGMMVKPTKEAMSFVRSFEPITLEEELKNKLYGISKYKKDQKKEQDDIDVY